MYSASVGPGRVRVWFRASLARRAVIHYIIIQLAGRLLIAIKRRTGKERGYCYTAGSFDMEGARTRLSDSLEEEPQLRPPEPKKKAIAGAATYHTKFKDEWRKEFPFISSVSGDPYRFRCNVCSISILCKHQGKADVKDHCRSNGHLQKAKDLEKQPRLDSCYRDKANLERKTTEAEVKMTVICAHANVPTAFHDKLSSAIRSEFTDSKVAANYHSASTKAMCMLNGAIAPSLLSDLIAKMKYNPFSLMIDGSNDSGLEKINPITVRIFDVNRIKTCFLDMCPTTSATAEALFNGMDSRLAKLLGMDNPWINCTALGVDNTSANIGVRNSLKTRIQSRNSSVYFNGCPCHILHNAAQKGADQFSFVCGFDIEEFVVDLFYWFDKSTKRKNLMQEYCHFCDHSYRAIVKHVSTRWLSLELAIERCLKQFQGLSSYFKSEQESQARFQRLQKCFENPMLEVYLLFFQSVLPALTNANKFMQREEPLIHVLNAHLKSLLKKVMGRFLKPSSISVADSRNELSSFPIEEESHHLSPSNIWIGFQTKQLLSRLLNGGDINEHTYGKFFEAAKSFLVTVVNYLQKWCPLNDDLLLNAEWLDFTKRQQVSFTSVEYFIFNFPNLFSGFDLDVLGEEFMGYQALLDDAIPIAVKTDVGLGVEDPHQVDALWAYLGSRCEPGTTKLRFGQLFKVAKAVLTIPHSNAGEERIFSLINKNRTPSRSSLQLEGTLSSIITVKTHITDPLEWKPTESLVKSAKKATMEYNRQHKKQ